MKVKHIMSTDPICCTRDTNLGDVARLMCDHDCGEIPVVDNLSTRRVIGVVTDRDITCRTVAAGRNPLELTANDCMSAPVVTITENASLEECCTLMEAKQIRRLPVVDGANMCRGVISQADLAGHVTAQQMADYLAEVSRPARANA